MKTARRITDNPYLADDILESIFQVKTLLRLKCLCKRYCTLISTSLLVYLKTFNSEPDNHCILVQTAQKIILNEPCTSNYVVVAEFNQWLGLLVTTTSSRKLICPFHKSIQDVPFYEPSNDTLCWRSTILQVYSTKLESWNVDFHFKMSTCRCDVIVEGFTYWVAK
ncbi:hypothetical protein H5410_021180, partial [Solanum commersonii]